MNMQRMIILGVAIVAAAAAAFLARGLLGGGTPKAIAMIAPPAMETREVLVASSALQPGQPLNASLVRWDKWPRSSVDSTFITREGSSDAAAVVSGTVVRSPIVVGGPITTANIVHSESAGFMAATLSPGMRAVSIPITTESGAGGFILPNDRVDLIMTELVSDNPRRFQSRIVLVNVRVLAVDQTYKQENDQKVVLAKTATLELTPRQSALVMKAQAGGPLSLALRPLDESKPAKVASLHPKPANDNSSADGADSDEQVTIIRFNISGRKD